jgi:tape measure domain-containing protein
MSGVEIRVRSNSRQARNDLNKLEQSVKNIETRTAAAGKAFRNLAIGIGAAFSGGAAVKGINNAADSLTNLENRIALVTGRGKDLDKTMNSLFNIAKRTRGDIAGSADTFNRFGIALKGTGRSSEDLLKAVTSVNKAVAISGSSAESARGALVQLGQGLAAGQLRGEELNSVLEAAPRLAQAIADEMNVPLGAIRAIAQEGKLTTELVFNALINQAEALSAEFETMQGTSEQAFSVMGDQIRRVVAEISKGLGITDKFTDRFNQISDSLETNREAIVSGVVGAFQSVGTLFSGIKTVATGVISIVAQVVDYIKELVNFGKSPELTLFNEKALAIAEKSLSNIVGFFAAIKLDGTIVKDILDNVADFLVKTFNTLGNYKDDALKSVAKYSKIASDNFKELYERAKRFATIKYVEFRGGKGVIKDYINYLKLLRVQRRVEASASRMFKTTADFAKKYLSQAWNSVKTFLNLIERKFYWVYDEVIQNSWWTDTMEQTYFLSEKWLGKASDAVGRFGNTVNQKFKGVFESFKSGASAFKDQVTISNVKIKFASLKDQFSSFASGFKENVTSGLKSAMEGLSQLSPVISAAFGAALVAGVTRFLSPELFKKTFGKIGPAAIAVLFAGIATDLANILKDAGIFSQLGANLGTTLAIAFDAILDAIPVLVDGLIQGVSSAGKAFGKALEGSIIGLPAKILSFLPGGGLLTAILYGSLGLSAISSKFRTAIFGMITSAVSRNSTLTSGAGILSSIFFGEDFTQKTAQANKIMKSSVALADAGAKKSLVRQTAEAGASIQATANRARVAHLGVMGAFAAGSVALLGDVIGTELSAIVGLAAGNIASSMLLTGTSFASLTTKFAALRNSITTGSVALAATASKSFKVMAVSANTSMASMSTTSKITSASIATNFRNGTALAAGSLKKLGKLGRLVLGGLAASAIFTSTANASTGGDAGGANPELAIPLAVGAMLAGPLLESIVSRGAKKLSSSFVGNFGRNFIKKIPSMFASIVPVFASAAAVLFNPITLISAAVLSVGGLAYIAFFGEGDSFQKKFNERIRAAKLSLGLLKENTAANQISLSDDAFLLGKRGQLGSNAIQNTQNEKAFEKLNLQVVNNRDADRLVRAMENLKEAAAKADAEKLALGGISNKTQESLEKAQRLTTAAVKEAGKNQITPKDVAAAYFTLSKVGQGLFPSSDSKEKRAQNRDAIENGSDDPSFAASSLFLGEGAIDRVKALESQFGKDVVDSLNKLAFDADIAKAEKDALTALFLEVSRISEAQRSGFNFIDAFNNFGNLATQQPAFITPLIKTLQKDAVQAEGLESGLIDRELSKTFSALREGLERRGEEDSERNINTSEAKELVGLFRKEDAIQSLLEDRLNQRVEGKRDPDLDLDIESARLQLEDVQASVESAIIRAVRPGFQEGIARTRFDNITNALTTAISDVNINRMLNDRADGVVDFFDFKAAADEIKVLDKMIEDIGAAAGSDDSHSIERVALLQRQIEELQGQIDAAAGLADAEFVKIDVEAANLSRDKMIELITSATLLGDIGIDADKLMSAPDTILQNLAKLATGFLTTAAARNLLNAGVDDNDPTTTAETLGTKAGAITKELKGLVSSSGLSPKGTGGGSEETMFEKFVGGLNSSGFSIDIETAANLSRSAIEGLQGPLKAIKDAQDKIKNASLGDNVARQASLKIIEEQRKAIAGILTSGTVGEANIGLEALGVDPSLATNAANLESLIKISELQDRLNDTLFTDFETRKTITGEIERQSRLLEGVTAGAEASADAIKGSIKESFSGLLKGTMTFKEAIHNVLDSISSQIIDTVVGSFVDAFFEASGMQDMFTGLFAGLFSGADSIGKSVGASISDGISAGMNANNSAISGMFSGDGFFGKMQGGLSNLFSGLSGGGGGGGLFSSLFGTSFGSIFGFSQGGVVPSTPFSQAGKDSVPAMLMPGEVVLSKNDVARQNMNQGQQQQVFNINVSGDVSRQTRQEIVKMMPQITSGVNMNNKENNFRRS